ncbi:hypothetical protein H257_08034 [Aphanomyces astaci]|uniref:Uncharacterized protein n=1 Tax=Aphanomyces astaci TaxID=112090 RepID=W4GHU4_APHAT|nr:hypothetical protein H257_08034 [Aphanomyces astaci]ETV78518.1 hypothetical protein H257_08034 [Aphanomyces astaci]|eukprot:XP_009832099.1 hypothetical protein H257_08034 [Aphanomyces astaci]
MEHSSGDDDDGISTEFLQDLQFLIATDAQLNDDLSFVCELLIENESASDHADDTLSRASDDTVHHSMGALCTTRKGPQASRRASTKPVTAKASVAIEYPSTGAKNRFQYRQKHEIQLLRAQVDALKQTLADTAKTSADTKVLRVPSLWEHAAKKERVDCKRVLEENAKLKGALDEQTTFIDNMQRLFNKKPRRAVGAVEVEAWQSYKLAAHRSLRVAAIHAIADRQLRRMQSALIQAGVFHAPNDIFFATPRPLGHTRLVLDFVNHVRIPAPYRTVSASCWQVLAEARDLSLPPDAIEECEVVDEFTVYQQFTQVAAGGTASHSNFIRKYYPHETQDVIAWRTVLEDALAPHMVRGAVDNEWGWLVLTPVADDATSCWVTFLHQVLVETNPEYSSPGLTALDATSHALKQFRFCERPPTPGRFSGSPADKMDIPDKIMHVFMSKGKRLELSLCAAVDNAILVAQSGHIYLTTTYNKVDCEFNVSN